jgi:putative membrane protein
MTIYGMAPTGHTGWILPTAVTVILLASVIAGVVLAAWYLTSPPPESGADPTVGLPGGAEEVLAQRYARGEIDDDEYQRRFETLHQDG